MSRHARRVLLMLAIPGSFPIIAQAQTADPASTASASPSLIWQAQQPTSAEAPPASPQPGDLKLSFQPYIWLTSYTGSTGAKGLEFDIDESFLDLVDKSDSVFGLMGAVDLEVNRWVFQLNGTYTTAQFSGDRARVHDTTGGGDVEIAADATIDLDSVWFEGFAGYRFLEKRIGADKSVGIALDGFAGFRYTDLELDQNVTVEETITLPNGITLEGGVPRGISAGKDWVEPLVGARAGFALGERWEIIARGDIGGFGVQGSQFSWQTVLAVGYRWQLEKWTLSLFGGYRALGQDYSEDEFVWDMVTHGPILGLRATFSF